MTIRKVPLVMYVDEKKRVVGTASLEDTTYSVVDATLFPHAAHLKDDLIDGLSINIDNQE